MHDYNLIAIDLDGTLLNDNNEVSKENLNAIAKLKDCGVYLAPCTGRSLAEILGTIKNNDSIRYIIYSNGAVVLDKLTQKTIKACISNQTALRLFEILSQYQVHYTIRANGNCYVEKDSVNPDSILFYNVIPAHEDVIKNYATEIENFNNWKNSLDDIEVVSIFFHSLREKESCKQQLSMIDEIVFVEACQSNLEILSKNASKSAGLARLSTLLGIEKNNVIGVGDSGNDIPMMQSAGMRLAVSNATKELKSVCDKIICSNNEHAVDYILNNFIIKN
jgi:Cof subfamily protein (haloacid dehalogenase superfamily)